MKTSSIRSFVSLLLLASAGLLPAQTSSIAIRVDQPGARVSSNLFGIFFEEINYAGEGGLYAEMVRNRSFNNSTGTDFWTLVTTGTAAGVMTNEPVPLNTNLLRSLRLTMQSGTGRVGAANSGFWGMSLQAGQRYDLSFYAKAEGSFTGPLDVRLESSSGGTLYAQAAITGLTTNWQRFTATLTANTTDANARLVVGLTQPATVRLAAVSLFPRATFLGRTNGMRADLANMLADLRPSFLRFPGGNFVEGAVLADAVRWKTTIGDLANRPGHWNSAWGYLSTDGLGQHEYLQLCEDLGCEPLFVIHCGLSLGYNGSANNTVPLSEMGPWVQDALDAIEYANGPTNSTWGARRAANGHPAPFNLKYIEIGNENGGSYYNDRYTLFYDAIKAKYPEMNLIACVWGGTPNLRPLQIIDEHYYDSPATFISYATKYDSYSRTGPKIYVGEYAVTQGYGPWGNLAAALGEAAFMTGMERNSDVVVMASYAPLFANVNSIQWKPDAIYYDSARRHGTPAYYVQELFSRNRGTAVLPMTVVNATNVLNSLFHGAIGVGSWNTSVQYSNIVVTSNGVTLYQSDFSTAAADWTPYNGNWSVANGFYQQTSITTDCRSTTGDTNWSSYTLSLRARKVSGNEGFLVLFNWLNNNNLTWWNVGGWNNTLTAVEQMSGGTKTLVGPQVSQSIATNVWYDLRVELTGPRIRCYLNNSLVEDVSYPSGLIASTTYDQASGQVVLKAVNAYNVPLATTVSLSGLDSVSSNATLIQLTAASALAENTLAAPSNVVPVAATINYAGTNFTATFPANSLSILRLQAVGPHFLTNLSLQLPSPINGGQTAAASVWGQFAGQGTWVNLATNANYRINYASSDPAIARVDSAGNVIGVDSGYATISAADSLGLTATQLVQVIGLPRVLAHRYSFGEAAGSTVAVDSIGGAAWNGTLPRGGTFGGGQLSLAAASQQYVQLPAGILGDFPMVTVEAWVTFPNQLPVNCFFYGFGNSSGSSGTSYIFCAPRAGRIAITPSNNAGEQNALGAGDLSFRTNLHFIAIYNPPAGTLTLYTNGVLTALNNRVVTPMSAVNDLLNYIGRSLYSGDPYPDLQLDEFRIYQGALRPSEIAATQILGPNQTLVDASPVLRAELVNGNLLLAWPLTAARFDLESRADFVSGAWTAVTDSPVMIGTEWQITLPITSTAQAYRLRLH